MSRAAEPARSWQIPHAERALSSPIHHKRGSSGIKPPDQHEMQEAASDVDARPCLPPADPDPDARTDHAQVVGEAAACVRTLH